MRYSVDPIVKNVSYHIVLGKGTKKTKLFKSQNPLMTMTVREDFDLFCLNKTLEKNVEFKIIANTKNILERKDILEIETNHALFRAKFIIGADGANSSVRKLMSLFTEVTKGLTIEGQIFMPKEEMPIMEFDFAVTKYGYVWLFPKDDHVNVGLYTSNIQSKINKESVHKYVLQSSAEMTSNIWLVTISV